MSPRWLSRFLLPVLVLAVAPGALAEEPPVDARLVEYAPGRSGFLYRPPGEGRYPAVVWNHGSEKSPGWAPELARFYVAHGYVFFLPHRRGHGRSPGEYIGDVRDNARMVAMQDEHNADVVAAIRHVQALPFVDAARVAVSGCSYGGIQTLLVAGKEVGLRAAVPFAPGAIMWPRSPEVRERLLRAAREARVPVLLIQAENDYDLGPSRVAGAELARAGRGRHEVRVYPPYGTTHQDGHGGFCRRGFDVWGRDVLDFLTRSFATTPPGR